MHSLDETQKDHRPWPLPEMPWVMFMRWHDLLFAHWAVNRAKVRAWVPSALELDTWQGEAWLGIVPFRMTDVGPRAMPAIPGLSAFPEINVRTYVIHEGKPGVWFFSLDADQKLAVRAARWAVDLPYYDAEITARADQHDRIAYHSRRLDGTAEFSARYAPVGLVHRAEPGSLEHWLVERYCLYSASSSDELWRLDIHHNPWPLQSAEADISYNTMAESLGLELLGGPKLHFASRQDVFAWLPHKAGRARL